MNLLTSHRKRVIDLNISTGKYEDFINDICLLAQRKESSSVCFANVHMVVEAAQNSLIADAVNQADIVAPDGMPVAKSLKLLYNQAQERIAGMGIIDDILQQAALRGLAVYFFGSTVEVLQKVEKISQERYPSLKIAGSYSPPFRPLTEQEEMATAQQINQSGAQMVLVALGCPKQELWMNRMKGKIDAVMLGIGGALPVFAGIVGRAPNWMQKSGLEWLHRLMQEPRRLFKRYAVTNSLFMYYLIQQAFTQHEGRKRNPSTNRTLRL